MIRWCLYTLVSSILIVASSSFLLDAPLRVTLKGLTLQGATLPHHPMTNRLSLCLAAKDKNTSREDEIRRKIKILKTAGRINNKKNKDDNKVDNKDDYSNSSNNSPTSLKTSRLISSIETKAPTAAKDYGDALRKRLASGDDSRSQASEEMSKERDADADIVERVSQRLKLQKEAGASAATQSRTTGVGGAWSPPPSMDNATARADYTPARSSWGVFDRPASISEAYGGGKRVGAGVELSPEEVRAGITSLDMCSLMEGFPSRPSEKGHVFLGGPRNTTLIERTLLFSSPPCCVYPIFTSLNFLPTARNNNLRRPVFSLFSQSLKYRPPTRPLRSLPIIFISSTGGEEGEGGGGDPCQAEEVQAGEGGYEQVREEGEEEDRGRFGGEKQGFASGFASPYPHTATRERGPYKELGGA